MSADRLRQIDHYLEQVIDLPPAERAETLARLCPDADVRTRVQSMLARMDGLGDRLAETIVASSQQLLDQVRRPERLGPYHLIREIGAGGMGTVWLAERADGVFQQQVAIKLLRLPFAGDAMRERFRRERQILAGLRHPHIGQLLDGGTADDGTPYLVMELIDGSDLARHSAGLPLPNRLRLFLQVCEAVEHAHRHLVIHRDLKMSNILVTPDGVVKLLDFGIAKVLEEGAGAVTGTQLMTPEYASPEQVLGQPVTTLSDVYSLGVVLYVLLTGRSPYRTTGASPAEMLDAVARQPVGRPDQGADLDTITLKALHKEPERRYQSVAELAADVRAYLEGKPIAARADSRAYRARKFVARNPWASAATAVALLLLVAFLATTLLQSKQLQAERDQARRQRDNAQWLSRYLVGVFQVADPREAGGEKISARELLDRGARRIAAEQVDPELRAMVGSTIGQAYYGLGVFPEAERLALDAYRAAKQSGSTEVRIQTLRVLEEVYGELAKPDPWLAYAQEHERLAGPGDSLQRAIAISEQGAAYRFHQKWAESRERHTTALAMLERIGAGASAEAGVVLSNAASTAYMSGSDRYPEAMDYAKRSVAVLRRSGRTSQLITSLNSVAVVAMTLNDFPTAETHLVEALELTRKLYGDRHPDVAMNYNNLCGLYTLMSRPAASLPYCQKTLHIRREVFPAGHRLIGIALNNLGKTYLAMAKWDEAEAAYREAYPILAKENGGPAARSAEGIGLALKGKQQWAAAAKHFHEALERWQKLGSKNVADIQKQIAAVEARR